MTDSTGSQQYLVSTIQAKSGLNFFYIQVWQEFGYTKMSLNVANENNSPTKLSQTLTFNGVYIKSSQTFNIGCRKVNSACTFPFIGAIRSLVIDDTVVATATLDALYSTTCSNDGVSSCGLCIVSGTGKCIEVLESTPKIKYVSLNIAAATTATSSILDTSGDSHNFGISTDYPFRIPEQGYVFAKDKYIKATTGFTLPEVFTVNLWFRMNTLVTVPDSQMQYLYLKTDSAGTTNKLFIGVTNSYLRIYIEGGIYDYVHAFSSNSNWRYLSVGFYKTSSSTTGIQIFLDMTKVSTQSIPKAFTDNSAYNVYVGKDFEGAINSFEIIPILYSELSVPPLLVTSG